MTEHVHVFRLVVFFPAGNVDISCDRAVQRRGRDFVVEIVSCTNPISCQLNSTLWNIQKSTQNA